MADTKNAPFGGYGPDMDGPAHEATYRGFVRFIEIGVSFAVGGIRHAWLSAVFGVVLAHITTGLGLFAPSLGWRPNAAVAVLLLLMLMMY